MKKSSIKNSAKQVSPKSKDTIPVHWTVGGEATLLTSSLPATFKKEVARHKETIAANRI